MKIAAPSAISADKSGIITKPQGKKQSKLVHNIGRGIEAGALATGLNYLLLPSPVKSGMKTVLGGQDRFVAKSVKQAVKTAQKAGETVNSEAVAEQAKNIFPKMAENIQPAFDALGKTFAGVAAGIFVGNMISDLIIEKQVNNK